MHSEAAPQPAIWSDLSRSLDVPRIDGSDRECSPPGEVLLLRPGFPAGAFEVEEALLLFLEALARIGYSGGMSGTRRSEAIAAPWADIRQRQRIHIGGENRQLMEFRQ